MFLLINYLQAAVSRSVERKRTWKVWKVFLLEQNAECPSTLTKRRTKKREKKSNKRLWPGSHLSSSGLKDAVRIYWSACACWLWGMCLCRCKLVISLSFEPENTNGPLNLMFLPSKKIQNKQETAQPLNKDRGLSSYSLADTVTRWKSYIKCLLLTQTVIH